MRSGDRAPTEMQAKSGYGRLSPLPRRVSPVSRFDRPTKLMKEGQAPLSTLTPMEEGASPLLQTASPREGPAPPLNPPLGKGDGSLLPFPKPLSLSLGRETWHLWYIGRVSFVDQHEVSQLNSC
jgi:hypothetical protein